MEEETVIVIGVIAFFVIIVILAIVLDFIGKKKKVASMPPSERAEYQQRQIDSVYDDIFGRVNLQLICPHCETKGRVRTKYVKKKTGISGGKATAAVLTGGLSMLATGLSRKESLTQAHCENCGSTWQF
jgi:hypothetical protein